MSSVHFWLVVVGAVGFNVRLVGSSEGSRLWAQPPSARGVTKQNEREVITMKSLTAAMTAAAALAAFAAPALAQGLEERLAQVEQKLADSSAPSAREIQSSVDAYLASAQADATLVGGAGSAGYDGGFWIRGGSFLLKTNLTLQTRYEYFDWDVRAAEAAPGGDLSGFSLPRVTLKFSGDATCDIHYYAELEFGHSGSYLENSTAANSLGLQINPELRQTFGNPFFRQDLGIAREAWIEYEAAPQAAFRMGLIKTPATRQLMTSPEMQQFVDISMASAYIGQTMPGYSDRNRDYGFMLHGAFGCDGELQYMLTVTNGDGPVHRNVIDGRTDDPLAFGARLNWDIMGHMGYEEGALRQRSCEWVAALGAWAHYFLDHRQENPLIQNAERLTWGVDAAVGWGGFSMTAAYNSANWDNNGTVFDGFSWLVQLGYLFPDTAWEVAARYSAYEHDPAGAAIFTGNEIGVAVNYYIDGHADKVTLDAAFISTDDSNILADTYAGYNATGTSDGMMLRLQWQLAL